MANIVPSYEHYVACAHPPAGFIVPCLPTKTDKLPSGSQCLHEIKHGGLLPGRTAFRGSTTVRALTSPAASH
jgi:hypothetical protein